MTTKFNIDLINLFPHSASEKDKKIVERLQLLSERFPINLEILIR